MSCCIQYFRGVIAIQAGLLGAAGLGSDSFCESCYSSHYDENTGLFLSWTSHSLHASLALWPLTRIFMHAMGGDLWVQFDIFDTDKLAGDARIPNAKILSTKSLVLT